MIYLQMTKNNQIVRSGKIVFKDCEKDVQAILEKNGTGTYDCILTTSKSNYRDHFFIEYNPNKEGD